MAKKLFMGQLNVEKQRAISVATDWFTTFLAFFAFDVFRYYYLNIGQYGLILTHYLTSPKLIMEQVFVPLILLLVYWISGYYNRPFERSRLQELLTTIYSQLFNAIMIYLAALTNDQLYMRRENWLLILVIFLLLFSFTYLGRIIVTASVLKKIKKRNILPRTVVIGLSKETTPVLEKLKNPSVKPNARVVAFLPFDNEETDNRLLKLNKGVPVLDSLDSLLKLCKEKKIDQAIIVPPSAANSTERILYFLYHLYPYDISIKINPDTFSIITPTVRLEDIMGEPFIDLSSPQISEFSKNVKRAIDIVAASAGMVILAPVFGLLALGVRMSGKGNVIYSQERIGIHRKPFRIKKFRSMVPDAEKEGVPLLSSDHDERITKIGKWMRKYRLDELPQMWNVLKGDMSLVGPRPERAYFIDKIVQKAPWYTLVLQVRPGVTSWGMVKYGYATDVDQMIERNRYDLIYLTNMSVAVDFKILIHTVKTVTMGEGK